ncbi:MAG: GspH/FimT family pseudopilin [Gammaproteobacteria bacterium]|nr:GspH/FimT family pseudopilin [Gammaproteobacteria bacterium]MBU1415083.1 GspH/FimT family pseudopilin [Gammaproteobacteria bacterium]
MDSQRHVLDQGKGRIVLTKAQKWGSSGFTLIELVIAIVIMMIAASFGLPVITDWIQNSQIRTAAENVVNGLQTARMEAVRSTTPVEFTLLNPGATGGTGWQVSVVRTGAIVQTKPDGEGSANAILTASPAGATTVTFSGLGRRTANASGSDMTQIDVDSAGLSAADSRDLRVTISAGGEIRMCDPNVSDTGDPRSC